MALQHSGSSAERGCAHLQLGIVDVESRRHAAGTKQAGAHLQRVLDDVHVGVRAAVSEVRLLAGDGARGGCTWERGEVTRRELSAQRAPAPRLAAPPQRHAHSRTGRDAAARKLA